MSSQFEIAIRASKHNAYKHACQALTCGKIAGSATVWPVAKTTKEKDELSEYAAKFASRGGKARAKALSPERRREIARQAALARWRRGKK